MDARFYLMSTKSYYLRLGIAALTACCAVAIGSAEGHAQQAVQVPLICESQGRQPEFCDTGEPVVNAQLTNQLSRDSCNGRVIVAPTGIGVISGCRAAFSLQLSTTRPIFPLL